MANAVMMFDCLGYPKDDPSLVIAKKALKKLLVLEPGRSYCQPCLSPIWDTGLACHALMEAGGAGGAARRCGAASTGWPSGRCSTWSAIGRCGGRDCARAAGPSNTPIRIIPISTTPPWSAMALDRFDRDALSRPAIDARRRMDHRHAKPQRRLGRVRCRQHLLLSQLHSVRRSRRAARSADRRRVGALRRLPGAARRSSDEALDAPASIICGASRKRTAPGSAAGAPTTSTAPGRCCARSTPPASTRHDPMIRRAVDMAPGEAARRWRLGRGRRLLLARTAARRGQGKHAVADRLGAARR